MIIVDGCQQLFNNKNDNFYSTAKHCFDKFSISQVIVALLLLFDNFF